jgi:hypothetical protein
VNGSLLQKFTEVTGIKQKPDWIKRKAYEDFGIELNSAKDIPTLDMHVRAFLYEDKAEWLKEKMRIEIIDSLERGKKMNKDKFLKWIKEEIKGCEGRNETERVNAMNELLLKVERGYFDK